MCLGQIFFRGSLWCAPIGKKYCWRLNRADKTFPCRNMIHWFLSFRHSGLRSVSGRFRDTRMLPPNSNTSTGAWNAAILTSAGASCQSAQPAPDQLSQISKILELPKWAHRDKTCFCSSAPLYLARFGGKFFPVPTRPACLRASQPAPMSQKAPCFIPAGQKSASCDMFVPISRLWGGKTDVLYCGKSDSFMKSGTDSDHFEIYWNGHPEIVLEFGLG